MNKTMLILLSAAWLALGCGTVKSWFTSDDNKPHEEFKHAPDPKDVEYDENGNPIFTDDQLSGNGKPFNWGGLMLAAGFIAATGLIARHLLKK